MLSALNHKFHAVVGYEHGKGTKMDGGKDCLQVLIVTSQTAETNKQDKAAFDSQRYVCDFDAYLTPMPWRRQGASALSSQGQFTRLPVKTLRAGLCLFSPGSAG